MSDEKPNGGPRDRERINIHEGYELVYWTSALNVSKEQLVAAVNAVGVMVKDVKKHLGLS